MRSKDVMKILDISRSTLYRYTKNGLIKFTVLTNKYYDYDNEDVFKLLKNHNTRLNIIYARVSTYKQKKDLDNQINFIKKYCKDNNIYYNNIIYDIASGLDLNRPNFSIILDDIFKYRIKNIIITYKDRLTRLSFSILKQIFKKFGTKIIVINKSSETNNEYFNDLLTLMHTVTTHIYSKRRKSKK